MISEEFIINQLNKITTPVGTKNLKIVCPFHKDTKPSLSISLGYGKVPPGVFYCFGCKSSGNWNTLATRLGLDQVVGQEIDYTFLKKKVELFSVDDELDLEVSSFNLKKWRRYPISFLKKFGLKVVWDSKFRDYFFYIPVYNMGEYLGYIKYKIYDATFGLKVIFNFPYKIIYPFDYLLDFYSKVLVLVEGPTDAWRVLYNNMYCGATLGLTLTDNILENIDLLNIEKIILLYDSDSAGYNAVLGRKEKNGLRLPGFAEILSKNYDVRVIFPPEGKDPDNSNIFFIDSVKSLYYKLGGTFLNEF